MEEVSYYSKSYEEQFNQIEQLVWHPWIGKKYTTGVFKVLIIGESHYINEDSKADWKDINSTRACLEEVLYLNLWNNHTYSNITKLLKGDGDNDPIVWDNIAYYNFIQRGMKTRSERPSWNDFYQSWECFLEVVDILKPDVCVFIGVTAANTFNTYMDDKSIQHQPIVLYEPISNVQPRKGTINRQSKKTDILFVKHSGMGFSASKWNDFLSEQMPLRMKWLMSLQKDTLTDEQKQKLLSEVFIPQLEGLAKELNLEYINTIYDFTQEPVSFMFKNPDWKDFKIGFEFFYPRFQGLTYGFYTQQSGDPRLSKLGGTVNSNWAYYKANAYYNWGDYAFEAIKDESLVDYFRMCLKTYLLEIAKDRGFAL